MEHSVEQVGMRMGAAESRVETRGLGATMAAAAANSVGRSVGGGLAVQAQRIIERLRQRKS